MNDAGDPDTFDVICDECLEKKHNKVAYIK